MSKRKQPQRLPPPISQGDGPIEAAVILTEYSGELAAVLWKTVRSVRLWSELTDADRPRGFDTTAVASRRAGMEGVVVPPAVRVALMRAASVLRPRARAGVVAKACGELAEWSAEQGRVGSALELMQAAALASPGDAELAHRVARLARTAGEYHRAESWYRQSVSRARRSLRWDYFARSYIGLGTVFARRGSYPQATKALLRGLRAARRFSIRPLVAAAAHELMAVGIRTDRPADVSRYGRTAVNAYGANHPRLPALSHDLGIYLLNAGFFEGAYRIIRATPADFGEPIDQLARCGSLARVAGGLGQHEVYADAVAKSEILLADPSTRPAETEVRLSIALGAEMIGDRERAVREAERVRELAATRGESQLGFAAESLLESMRNGDRARAYGAEAAALTPTPQPLDDLVKDLELAMGGGPGRGVLVR